MVPDFTLIGPTDPCVGWDGAAAGGLAGEGAYAGIAREADRTTLARDPLGLGKLFWARAPGGTIELANRPARLTDRGHALADCAALPANTVVTYSHGEAPPMVAAAAAAATAGPTSFDGIAAGASLGPMSLDGVAAGGPPGSTSFEGIAAEIRAAVGRYVGAVLDVRPGPVIVCLSGGLDSTSVAALVREHRDEVVAVTFDLTSPDGGGRSDDFRAAEAAARHLGVRLVPAIHRPGQLLDQLDTVLVAGIDWRDFNVHAGLVNVGLARTIADVVGPDHATATVFTGDLVNELVADYHSESYGGRTYYRLPRLGLAATRAALVRGLATSHREIGVFGELGLTVVQPYSVAREQFLRLPEDVLGPGDGKGRLYRAMFGDRLPATSYDRPKTRAQTGSETGSRGVLAACVDAGLDEADLARRFARLHGVDDPATLTRFLRAGRYRTAIPRGEHDTPRPL